ncbi:hypothetical protein EYF80_023581 [Liparis tanakae]|uniref:Uncharacterized protein n=1 Tax=Liparis tanakae TaxID=230148 RepID=A0A4Z2HN79_9TELE|nr:hypothetical protein EYF80_023581 [Liparis tanakae]
MTAVLTFQQSVKSSENGTKDPSPQKEPKITSVKSLQPGFHFQNMIHPEPRARASADVGFYSWHIRPPPAATYSTVSAPWKTISKESWTENRKPWRKTGGSFQLAPSSLETFAMSIKENQRILGQRAERVPPPADIPMASSTSAASEVTLSVSLTEGSWPDDPDVSWYEDICPARGLKALEALDPRGYHLSTDDRLDTEYIRH